VGIPPDALPHVFDLFSQVRVHQQQAEGGLGIGLSIVRSLAAMHGGDVSASSDGLGAGSTFTVRLPLSPDDEKARDRPDGVTVSSHARPGLRVLVVDDNDDAASTFAMLLEARGHVVETAHDGFAALEKAESFAPDVVFLDLGMPGMNGFDAGRRLRAMKREQPMLIAALSGWGQTRDRERTQEAGFDAHLVKPPKMKEIVELLERARSRSHGIPAGHSRSGV
jgi:CheY-like chemotaxis protein